MTILDRWALANMEFEGWSKGSVSYVNSNPGNLKWPGLPADRFGHSIFPTFQAGYDRLIEQLELARSGRSRVYTPNDTLLEFYQKYSEANSLSYAGFVAKRLGVSIYTKIKDIH